VKKPTAKKPDPKWMDALIDRLVAAGHVNLARAWMKKRKAA
jgi:hypothetical protein